MSNYNYLSTAPSAWSSTVNYTISNITGAAAIGLGYVSCPLVTDKGATWSASNPTVQPTYGTHPANDAAWVLVQSGTVYNASSPVATNDKTQGYAVGTLWVNTTSNVIYYCSDNTTTAAVWTATTA